MKRILNYPTKHVCWSDCWFVESEALGSYLFIYFFKKSKDKILEFNLFHFLYFEIRATSFLIATLLHVRHLTASESNKRLGGFKEEIC